MKTLEEKTEVLRTQAQSYRVQNNGSTIDVYQYYDDGITTHKYVVEIQGQIMEKDNYHLLINHRHLKLIVSEVKEINRPVYVHHYSKQLFEKRSYECLRAFSIKLPFNSNLYIEQNNFDPERKILRVLLKEHLN